MIFTEPPLISIILSIGIVEDSRLLSIPVTLHAPISSVLVLPVIPHIGGDTTVESAVTEDGPSTHHPHARALTNKGLLTMVIPAPRVTILATVPVLLAIPRAAVVHVPQATHRVAVVHVPQATLRVAVARALATPQAAAVLVLRVAEVPTHRVTSKNGLFTESI